VIRFIKNLRGNVVVDRLIITQSQRFATGDSVIFVRGTFYVYALDHKREHSHGK
jgi:hypothetical protein